MKRLIVIIPAAELTRANDNARLNFDPRGGQRTFTTPLSPTGAGPATHYICSGLLETRGQGLLQAWAATRPGATLVEWDWAGTPDQVATLLAQLGLKIIQPLLRSSVPPPTEKSL